MAEIVKNWALLVNDVNVVDAIKTLETQQYKGDGAYGTFAIKSNVTGRVLTSIDRNDERMSIGEIKGTWSIFVPDTEKENRRKKIISLAKNSNWLGLTYNHLDNIELSDLWDYMSERIGCDEELRYKVMKHFFENNLYRKK